MLVIGPLYFSEPLPHDAARGAVRLRRHIDRLTLRCMPLSVFEHTSPDLLAVLPWFDTIDHLDLDQRGHSERKDSLATVDKSWRLAVDKLTLTVDADALRTFVEDVHPLGIADLASHVDLTVVCVRPVSRPALETFMKIYGSRLERFSLVLHYNFKFVAAGKYTSARIRPERQAHYHLQKTAQTDYSCSRLCRPSARSPSESASTSYRPKYPSRPASGTFS